ncbi:MAG: VanW family protein [Lachnospiraceae bacterium]|nr:VanW family protein [Lachnospiraceae bacterium]
MKKFWKRSLVTVVMYSSICIFGLTLNVDAKGKTEDKIEAGIYADDINLAGMTVSEAKSEIQAYVDSFADTEIILHAVDDQTITATASELGLKWKNQDIVDEAVGLGKKGNIVQCYKALKDLEHSNKVYDIVFEFDKNSIKTLIEEESAQYNQPAVDTSLIRENGVFKITHGQSGVAVDVDASTDDVYTYLTGDWNGEVADIDLVVEIVEPRGSEAELAQVKDVLGTFTTSYSTSGSSRSANVSNGCRLIDGCTLYPGDEFSAYEAVSPFTEANGYYMAGSYLNGQVVDSLGGGICQVSTTLYNAVLRAELEVTQRYNHSMIVTYVDPSADAAIAESSGKDFKFVNNTDYPIYIEGNTTSDKHITFTIYGVETRDSNRKVSYESVVLETNVPDTEVIYTNASLPVGYCSVQSAHIGYKAQLWKVVTVDGVEVSREQVNSSSYNKAPRSATVGIATEDPNVYNTIMAAVASNSIDQVKAVAGAYQATADAAAAQAALDAAAAQAAQQAADAAAAAQQVIDPEQLEVTPDESAP